jgi:hypothetical protein
MLSAYRFGSYFVNQLDQKHVAVILDFSQVDLSPTLFLFRGAFNFNLSIRVFAMRLQIASSSRNSFDLVVFRAHTNPKTSQLCDAKRKQ